MTKVLGYLEKTDFRDKNFVGTVAFRNEELTLPDGSKMALGIDDGHWVLVFQKGAGASFQVFEFDQHEKKVAVDKKPGTADDLKQFKKLIGYLFASAEVDDLVTLLPPQVVEK
ncbi:MAG: hypothetical protein PHG97_05555 [Candidatus Margulisbacteria bacterium]|nr:hypothetical protein [Candidatus Margulisiibacteriota bacterium]